MSRSRILLRFTTAVVSLCSLAAQAALPRYKIEGIGDYNVYGPAYASGLNNLGQVVGSSQFGGTTAYTFIYQAGQMTKLEQLGTDFMAYDINDRGDLVGWKPGNERLYFPVMYRDGRLIDLSTSLPPGSANAHAVNESGHVAGIFASERPSSDILPFYYDGRTSTVVPRFGGFVDINEQDVMLSANGWIYDHGRIEELPPLDAEHGFNGPEALNDLGQVVGRSERLDNEYRSVPFLYSNGVMKNLGTLGGATAGAFDINNAGWVVGLSGTSDDFDAFLYVNCAMHNIEDLLISNRRGHWDFHSASAINDRGQILINGVYNPDLGNLCVKPRQVC